MPNVKGTTLSGRANYVTKHFGGSKLTEVLEQLVDQKFARILRQGVLRSSWYPFDGFVDFIECIDKVCGSGDGSLYRRMAGQVAEDDLTSVYKVFFRESTPAYVFGKASMLWNQYYDSGELLILKDEPRSCTLEIGGFATPHRVHCESIAGWFEKSIQMTGATGVMVDISSCRASGDDQCVFECRWS